MNVHIIYDSIYCQEFADFINIHFKHQKHCFIIFGKLNAFKYIKSNTSRIIILDPEKDGQKFISYLRSSNKVFIHYLFDWICGFWVNNKLLSIPTYWMTWGGDFYPYIEYPIYGPETTSLLALNGMTTAWSHNSKERILFLKHLKGILTWCNEDYSLITQYYNLQIPHYEFCYPILFMDDNKKINIREDAVKEIILGNSASPSNNHIDLFNVVYENMDDDLNFLVPFSYGGMPWYTQQVKKYGQYLFKDRICFLDDFIEKKQYTSILNNVYAGCFYHMRQQGVGTTLLMLGQGKRVFAYESPAIKWLRNNNIQIDDISAISQHKDNNFNGETNARDVRLLFSCEKLIENMKVLCK